ncbi:MAG: D-alanyl-D-alanine carboxypeptidase [Proteobacteria bacterium]|nr:MAG: D-alanyl-D-alanine carboxypeptidase [Pseudomonadota bacterium]
MPLTSHRLFGFICALIASTGHCIETFPSVPAPPTLAVASFVLLDYATGSVLAELNPDDRAEPASLTKIMTTYVAADAIASGAIALSDKTTVSEKAWRMEGSRMFIEVNKQVTVDELLQGIIIQSGNDASVALAEAISGSEEVFAAVMNHHAARLGMTNSNFSNSAGMPDPLTYSTARDLALLTAALIRDFPEIYRRFAEMEYTYAGIRQFNRNRLLHRDASVDGVKTGRTEAAGYCLVSAAERGDMRLIAVVMGADSDTARIAASQALLNYGFRFYESRKIYSAGDVIATHKVWKGASDEIDLSVAADVHIAIPRGKFDLVEAAAVIAEVLEAPIEQGQSIGRVVLTLDDKVVASVPLVATHAVTKGSIFSRAIDAVMMRLD